MDNPIEITKNVGSWGNSAGILLPKEWLGNKVKIVLIERSLEIKKEVISMIWDYLEDILGVYLTGSYSRGEQEEDSDIDVIVISHNTKKEIISGKYSISIIPIENIKKTLKDNPILILPRLNEAKTILNPLLLNELKTAKISKVSFKKYLGETHKIIKINQDLLNLEQMSTLESNEIIYSLILRLRGIYLINCILQKENYTKKRFLEYLCKSSKDTEEIKKAYSIYKKIRDEKSVKKLKLKKEIASSLINFAVKELNKLK
jgi:predicted nucleotidyltransferase